MLKNFPISQQDFNKIIKPVSWWNKLAWSDPKTWMNDVTKYCDDIKSIFDEEGQAFIQKTIDDELKNVQTSSETMSKVRVRQYTHPISESAYAPGTIYPTLPLTHIRQILTSIFSFYSLIPQEWFEQFVRHRFIKDKKILEVFAGSGILARGLQFHGIDIHPTDDLTWFGKTAISKDPETGEEITEEPCLHSVYVNEVEQLGALDAVNKYADDYEMLLFSWPPVDDEILLDACRAWTAKHPDGIFIYIGEGKGGCTGTPELHKEYETIATYRMFNYGGIYDQVMFMKKR